MIKVAIIEDDRLMIEQTRFELEKSGEATCVLVAETAGQFFEKLPIANPPDVLLLDLALRGKNSITQLSMIRRLLPETKILVFTGFSDENLLIEALREGADGYYLKGSEIKLIHAIRSIAKGGAYIEPDLAGAVVRLLQNPDFQAGLSRHFQQAVQNLSQDLSKREVEVVHGLSQGLSYKKIGQTYNISINTVRHYIKSVYKKLGVSSKKELFRKLSRQIPK